MSRTSHCIAIAVLALAAIPTSSGKIATNVITEPGNAPIILLAGIIFLAVGIATSDLLSKRRRSDSSRYAPSAAHLKGWETRRTRESQWRRQHNAELRQKLGLDQPPTRH